jgi:hypothetical protein
VARKKVAMSKIISVHIKYVAQKFMKMQHIQGAT